jgi:hypothetical protein
MPIDRRLEFAQDGRGAGIRPGWVELQLIGEGFHGAFALAAAEGADRRKDQRDDSKAAGIFWNEGKRTVRHLYQLTPTGFHSIDYAEFTRTQACRTFIVANRSHRCAFTIVDEGRSSSKKGSVCWTGRLCLKLLPQTPMRLVRRARQNVIYEGNCARSW